MRNGFTTGSCAAAAAKAAVFMLLSGNEKKTIGINTPAGVLFSTAVNNISRTEESVTCSVTKDGGDDPDVTTGMEIFVTVEKNDQNSGIVIKGGKGVGVVTRPGLDQPVGEAAINHVPREMIRENVAEVCSLFDHTEGITVTVSVPGGEELALKTFNPRLGIEGGISIIGTSGIVEPMSESALIETIYIELRQRREMGFEDIVIAPGNYGRDFLKSSYGFDVDKSVKCSNYIGKTLDSVAGLGFKRVLLTGHVGKLIKISGGIMNTHSAEGDCRMELMAAWALKAGADAEMANRILDCISTEAAIEVMNSYDKNLVPGAMERAMDKMIFHMDHRLEKAALRYGKEKPQIESIMFDNINGKLAASAGAEEMLAVFL
ncbi:MAG: cobalt-precorrin-5B (C(1))-methyltransferase CbiD [Lachnospiraceae bacterium]|nr:cobalt-precorrin-5B (C(1))-methyltransferase CbiD [Lachnospiraceae bacterium]